MTNYSDMTLREELETRLDDYENQQRIKEILSKNNLMGTGYRVGEFLGTIPANYRNSNNFEDFIMNYMEPSVQKGWQESKRLTPMRIPDGNKHAYVSCVGAQGGALATMETLAGGMWKEAKDLMRKLPNPEKYNGIRDILRDTGSDLVKDFYGAKNGYYNPEPGYCDRFLNTK